MSDVTPSSLSVARLLEELPQVTDWYILGVHLEIPTHKLDKIHQQFLIAGVERCKAALFDLWLNSCLKASWEMIAVALEKCGEKVLAENVRKRHSCASSLPTVASQVREVLSDEGRTLSQGGDLHCE